MRTGYDCLLGRGEGRRATFRNGERRLVALTPNARVGVESLNRAHEIAAQGTARKLRIDKNDGRARFLVRGEAGGGIWVEFVQQQ